MTRSLAALALALVALLAMASPALARSVSIRKVDTTRYPDVTLSVQVDGEKPRPAEFALRENGRIIERLQVVPIGETTTPIATILVIDVSGSMLGTKLDQAKLAAKQFLARKLPNEEIAVVAFSDRAEVRAQFTGDTALLTGVIDSLQARSETALYDGVLTGASLLSTRREAIPNLQGNLVVLSDGKDTVSQGTPEHARAAARAAHAVSFTVGLRAGGDFDAGFLSALATDTGGQYVETSDARQLSSLYGRVQAQLQNQYEVSYRSAARGTLELDLAVGGDRAHATANLGGVSEGSNTRPVVVDAEPIPTPFTGSSGKAVIGGLAFLAVALLGGGLVVLITRHRTNLDRVLQPYAVDEDPYQEPERNWDVAHTGLLQRAVDATARVAQRRGIVDLVERRLEQADLLLRPAEAVFVYVLSVALAALLGAAWLGMLGFLIAVILVGLAPVAALSALSGRRKRAFASQLPDTLQLLASSLRAGYSLMQGLEAVSQEVDEPMGKELRRALVESQLGRPAEDALGDVADRMESPDFEWAVMAIRIQREVGGNLAELLITVAHTMIERERLRREVRALTAEGRISAIVLGVLPLGLGVMMYVLNPAYSSTLFRDTLGQVMVGASIVLALAGFLWMKKTIEVEI